MRFKDTPERAAGATIMINPGKYEPKTIANNPALVTQSTTNGYLSYSPHTTVVELIVGIVNC